MARCFLRFAAGGGQTKGKAEPPVVARDQMRWNRRDNGEVGGDNQPQWQGEKTREDERIRRAR